MLAVRSAMADPAAEGGPTKAPLFARFASACAAEMLIADHNGDWRSARWATLVYARERGAGRGHGDEPPQPSSMPIEVEGGLI